MEQRNIKILSDLAKKSGNSVCADCGSKDIEYASYNLGIFICSRCALIHNQLGSHVSKTKHLKLDHWEDSQIERMKQVGNIVAKSKYEARVPAGFRKPFVNYSNNHLPQDEHIHLEHWITSKYAREEFIQPESSYHHTSTQPLRPYLLGTMDSFLMKKGREDSRFFPRRFILQDDTLRYFVKEKASPKAVIRLIHLDVSICPFSKTGKENSLQFSYLKDGSTRHIYVCHDDPEIIMQWYQAIRIAKLSALKNKCSSTNVFLSESMLLSFLPQDNLMEGFLWKAGPSPSYAHRRRWFILSPHRKLMYHIDNLEAYPKGEIFLGTSTLHQDSTPLSTSVPIASRIFDVDIKTPSSLNLSGYKCEFGGFGEDKMDSQRYVFSLTTPYRTFILAAESPSEREKWVALLDFVMRNEITSRDVATCHSLVRKRNGSTLSMSNPLSGLLSSSSSSSSSATPSLPSSNCEDIIYG